jgi:hypothetical protein
MGGSKPKAPKSETTTVVKQPDAPDPIFFEVFTPQKSFEDIRNDIRFAQRQAGDLERASDMMGLSPGALGIQDAATQLRADNAYRASLPTGLEGSIYQTSDKLAADSAANYEQVKKDAAGFDRKYADDQENLYDYGPADRDDDEWRYSTPNAEGGGGRRRRRRDDDDDGGRRRRGRRDDEKDKDKKGKRKKASAFAFYTRGSRTGHPDGRNLGRKGLYGPPLKIYRKKGGRTRVKRVSDREFYRKSEQMRWKRKADKSGRRARAAYVSKRYSRFKKRRGKK